MPRSRALAGLLLSLVGACSALHQPDPRPPEQAECDGGDCNVDLCARCDPRARCEMRDGGADCVCPRGYADVEGDGEQCVRETRPQAPVDAGRELDCEIDASAPECACAEGYERGARGCEDIDECAAGTHDCDGARCMNEAGGFSCVCPSGFRLRDDGRSCADVDECSEFAAPCAKYAICLNSPGSFECRCEQGYAGDAQISCADADECAHGLLECSDRAACHDLPGADRCVCPSYYSDTNGDGSVCYDDRVDWALFAQVNGAYLAVSPAATSGGAPHDEHFVVAGSFEGEQTEVCADTTLRSNGLSDVYVAMYRAADHSCLWARSLGGSEYDWVRDVAIDPLGGVVLLIWPRAAFALDGSEIEVGGSQGLALIRLDETGALDWSLLVPDGGSVAFLADYLRIDATGNIYLRIQFNDATSIGELGFAAPPGLVGSAVVKISPAGTPLWAYTLVAEASAETNQFANILALATDAAGQVYLYGNSRGSVHFDSGPLRGGAGQFLQFLVALDPQGTPRWIRAVPVEAGLGQFMDLEADTEGVVWAMLEDYQAGERLPMIKRFNAADGTELSKRDLGAGPELVAVDLELSAEGGLLVSGFLRGSATIAGDQVSRPDWSVFLASLDSAEQVLWTHTYEPTGSAIDLAAAPSGAIYLSGGNYDPPVHFSDRIVAYRGNEFVIRLRP